MSTKRGYQNFLIVFPAEIQRACHSHCNLHHVKERGAGTQIPKESSLQSQVIKLSQFWHDQTSQVMFKALGKIQQG